MKCTEANNGPLMLVNGSNEDLDLISILTKLFISSLSSLVSFDDLLFAAVFCCSFTSNSFDVSLIDDMFIFVVVDVEEVNVDTESLDIIEE